MMQTIPTILTVKTLQAALKETTTTLKYGKVVEPPLSFESTSIRNNAELCAAIRQHEVKGVLVAGHGSLSDPAGI